MSRKYFFSMELYFSNNQTALTGNRLSVLPAEMFEGLLKKVPQLLAMGVSFLATMSVGNPTVQEMRVVRLGRWKLSFHLWHFPHAVFCLFALIFFPYFQQFSGEPTFLLDILIDFW